VESSSSSFNVQLTSATFNNASTRYIINPKTCKRKHLIEGKEKGKQKGKVKGKKKRGKGKGKGKGKGNENGGKER